MAATPYRCSGKVVAISGAARGIGYATAQTLRDAGAVVSIGDINETALREAADSLDVSAFSLDVTSESSFVAFINSVEERHGAIDILINNAGIMPVGPLAQQSEALIQRTIDIDLLGVIRGCRIAADRMAARGGGHIINVASIAGRLPAPGLSVYNAAKFGVIGFSEALDAELSARGVSVSTIQPTFTKTHLIDGLEHHLSTPPVSPQDVAAAILQTIQTRQLHTGVPRSIAASALFGALPGRLKRKILSRRSYAQIFTTPDSVARHAYDAEINTSNGGSGH